MIGARLISGRHQLLRDQADQPRGQQGLNQLKALLAP